MDNMKTYLFKLPIGDTSGDGHGICNYHLMKSNKTEAELKDIYKETKKRTNSSLDGQGAPCNEWEDCTINEEQIKALGLNPEDYKEYIEEDYIDKEGFIKLFIDYMTTHNTDVKIEKAIKEEAPVFNTCGGYLGYGLF